VLIRIDPSSGESLFDQLAAAVRAEVGRGVLRPGDRLPAARELAASLDINVHTVLRAYQVAERSTPTWPHHPSNCSTPYVP
jgi:GntR family transcriptional regulator